jgi:hypothetical protein
MCICSKFKIRNNKIYLSFSIYGLNMRSTRSNARAIVLSIPNNKSKSVSAVWYIKKVSSVRPFSPSIVKPDHIILVCFTCLDRTWLFLYCFASYVVPPLSGPIAYVPLSTIPNHTRDQARAGKQCWSDADFVRLQLSIAV